MKLHIIKTPRVEIFITTAVKDLNPPSGTGTIVPTVARIPS
jgi:hypothetical protein